METTTLSDATQTFINGIQTLSAMEFTANYTKEDFEAVLEDAKTPLYYSLEFGENGPEGYSSGKGSIMCG